MCPESTNTVRILTMWNYETGKPFIATAIHRFGTSRIYPVDNLFINGEALFAGINLDNGELSDVAYCCNKSFKRWYSNHPETNGRIKGIKIPFWNKIKSDILHLAVSIPYVNFVGWDIVVTDEDFSVIEANSRAGLEAHQIIQPLLTDGRVKRFCREHRLL